MNIQFERDSLQRLRRAQELFKQLAVTASNPANGQHVPLNWDVDTMSPAFENMTPLAQRIAGPRVWAEFNRREAEKERIYECVLLHSLKQYQDEQLLMNG